MYEGTRVPIYKYIFLLYIYISCYNFLQEGNVDYSNLATEGKVD